jgi:hypothetical protein
MSLERENSGFRDSEIAKSICLGREFEFKNTPCEHFDLRRSECRLLRDGTIRAVLNQRCLSGYILYLRAYKILRRRHPSHKGEDLELECFISGNQAAGGKRRGLLDYPLGDPTIHHLYAYLDKSLEHEIYRILEKRGLIPDSKKCGTCFHLSAEDPSICTLKEIENEDGSVSYNHYFGLDRNKNQRACESYSFVRFSKTLSEIEDKITRSDDGAIVRVERGVNYSLQTTPSEARMDVRVILSALMGCIDKAGTEKKREIFERWYIDIAFLYNDMKSSGLSYPEAKSNLLNLRVGRDKKKEREAYAAKLNHDHDQLEKCLSGKTKCN